MERPTKNSWLMQFQSDILNSKVRVSEVEELSCLGAALVAGLGIGLYDKTLLGTIQCREYVPDMASDLRVEKYEGWKRAVGMVIGK